ncbi:DUF4942 domain-containing protein [Microbulbifer epialgicus]|uniref:DUF4942 domain-containing protein n=1 Tax=Microbulbifer epialgicus TaxID=393907 RepID=A0ABV4NTN7_9GAMM
MQKLPSTETSPSVSSLVSQIKAQDQDFEWYPTTEEILNAVKRDIDEMTNNYAIESNPSVLDCGAGDGRSLMYLTDGKRYAIEKAEPLVAAMDHSIFVIGAEFQQQILIDKSVDIVFCNPPYSEYSVWTAKIIRETKAGYAYFVIPERWESDRNIENALMLRNAEAKVIGSFDFLNAERQARAKVAIVKVQLASRGSNRRDCSADTDPFELWFDANFDIKTSEDKSYNENIDISPWKERLDQALIVGSDVVTALVSLYEHDMDLLVNNYKSLETLDPVLLTELAVSLRSVKEGLRTKISGLKNKYWLELFNNLNTITSKLTKSTREKLLNTLTSHTDVDFNVSNVYAVVIWVIKNANYYYDDQLVSIVERMVERANVTLYKSNQQIFRDEDWRYVRKPYNLCRFSLETRAILQHEGGLFISEWNWEKSKYNGLSERAYWFLVDILIVANNLGFDTTDNTRPMDFTWEANKSCEFYYRDHHTQKDMILMNVKAFMNGNLHIKFNQAFMCRLNVEFGRLKGWLKTAQEAAEEMDISVAEAADCFKTNFKLEPSNILKLGFQKAA